MLLVEVLCSIALFISIIQTDGHELYVADKKFTSRFREMNVKGIQECVEACNKDRKCGAFALSGHAQCFVEDPSGGVEFNPNLSIMVKSSHHGCKKRCPEAFITLGMAGGCYYPVLDQILSWEEAEAACQELDPRAHLISINNEEVNGVNQE